MKYKVAVLGATGNVGREILSVLAERNFPISEIAALGSKDTAGKLVSFGPKRLTVQAAQDYDFTGTEIVLSATNSAIIEQYAPRITKAGAILIDNSSHFRMRKDVPLIIPEVNPETIEQYKQSNIIANPNCATIQLLLVLKPLHDLFSVKRVVLSTYQATSGQGIKAQDELYDQTKKMFENDLMPPKEFTKRIAFNCIPHIGEFMDNGFTGEEWKIHTETQKILDPNIKVSATCVRVAVFNCHAEAVNVEFEKSFSLSDIYDALSEAPGILTVDRRADGGYVTQVEISKDDNVYVSRIRIDHSVENGLNMWIVGDNLRKGAALNAVQIAELLIRELH
jgi:aspartate-semialdehyde dehydrogenase